MYVIMLKKRRRSVRGKHLIYRVWYDDEIVYVGRTGQHIPTVLRRHFFSPNKQYPKIDVLKVTRIDIQEHKTLADCSVYVAYYRNKYKPRLNGGLWEQDELSFHLPRVKWIDYFTSLMDQWKEEAYLIKTHQREKLKQKRIEWKQEQIREQQIRVPKLHPKDE